MKVEESNKKKYQHLLLSVRSWIQSEPPTPTLQMRAAFFEKVLREVKKSSAF